MDTGLFWAVAKGTAIVLFVVFIVGGLFFNYLFKQEETRRQRKEQKRKDRYGE